MPGAAAGLLRALPRRLRQEWELLTRSAAPSPVVVAVADLQAL